MGTMSESNDRTLTKLREAAAVTQTELAQRLGKRQPAISRLERQDDALISTLREYIAALGGELELRARFPGWAVRLKEFE